MKKGWFVLIIITALAIIALSLPAGVISRVAAESTPVSTIPEWVNFYGVNSTLDGAPLPIGAEIIAYAGSARCGSFIVHTPGQYGVLPCYRDQPSQPGANPGDPIRFTVNGYEAILRGPDEAVWTVHGDLKHVELEAHTGPQTPTHTPTQTVLPTSTPNGTVTVPPPPTHTPAVPPTITPWVSPTPTFWAPPTPVATLLPPTTPLQAGYCRDIIVDGSFEAGGGWIIDPAPRQASRSTSQAHSGSYSMRLGIVDESNVSSPSAIRQRVDIPADATYALLAFYYYPVSEPDPRTNYWEVLLLEPGTNTVVATLWRNNAGNERRWLLMNVDLLGYRGRSFDLYFNLYNDGQGGKSGIYIDDVVLQLCTPAGVTATPTPTPIIVTVVPTPVTPYPTPPGACQELVVNGNFETGAQGWELGRTERMAHIVSDPRHGGNQAMELGFIDGPTVNTFSSIRQTVTIPHDVDSAVITFWTYPMSTAASGEDHQEFVILSPYDNSTIALPWRVWHDNSRVWTQQRFDLTQYKGQSVVIYFNAYNDGLDGNTAMVVDDISLQACRQVPPTAIPLAMSPQPTGVTATQSPASGGIEYPGPETATPAPGAGSQETGMTPTVSFAHPTPTSTPEPSLFGADTDWSGTILAVAVGIVVAAIIVGVVLLVTRRKRNGGDGETSSPGQSGGGAGGGGVYYTEMPSEPEHPPTYTSRTAQAGRRAGAPQNDLQPPPAGWEDDNWMEEPPPFVTPPDDTLEPWPNEAPETPSGRPSRPSRPPVRPSSKSKIVSSVKPMGTIPPQPADEVDVPFPEPEPPVDAEPEPPASDDELATE